MEQEKENNFQFGVFSNSQNSDLDEQELDKLVIDSKPENTKRSTAWGYSKFARWMEKRDIHVDLKAITAERLNEILRKFYAEVTTDKNQMLTPSSLVGIRAAISRTIISPPYSRSMNIVGDREFVTANEMFSARCKLYYKTHNKKPQHKASIAKEDMELLKHYFSNCLTDPVKLQEYIWFNLCLHFGRRGREGWRELQKEHFQIQTDADGNRYVETIVTESTKNNPGGYKQSSQDYSDVRMYEVDTNPLDPVRSLNSILKSSILKILSCLLKPRKYFQTMNGTPKKLLVRTL